MTEKEEKTKKETESSSGQSSRGRRAQDWVSLIAGYLYLAKTGCQSLLDNKKRDYFGNYLIIAILYNIKHSIEITFKFFVEKFSTEEDKLSYPKIHNIGELIQRLEKIKKEILPKLDSKEVGEFVNNFERLTKISQKYLRLDVLKKHIKAEDFDYEDAANAFLRYPDQTLNVKISFGTILARLTETDIKEIFNDIVVLENAGAELDTALDTILKKGKT